MSVQRPQVKDLTRSRAVWPARRPHKPKVGGSNPSSASYLPVAAEGVSMLLRILAVLSLFMALPAISNAQIVFSGTGDPHYQTSTERFEACRQGIPGGGFVASSNNFAWTCGNFN